MRISTTKSFTNISVQGYLILALFSLVDRTTCQLTKKSVIASSGKHFSLLFLLNVLIFLKLTPKMRNSKLKVPNQKIKEKYFCQTKILLR